ncbi:MAG: helix-turn-helix transcriptional regulator [Balneolales bacterium]|nr:helix-turn-helix transcriptional regulator [Balneolales bacterium]
MLFLKIPPIDKLQSFIDCYWVIENSDESIYPQKIIPDGFPEIIFHYGDPYRINISGTWQLQEKALIGGQIRNHFMLENTGVSGMIGIKFKPFGITKLFGVNMLSLTDTVIPLNEILEQPFEEISESMDSENPYSGKIDSLNEFFSQVPVYETANDQLIELAIRTIFRKHGLITVSELNEIAGTSERKLERLFNKYIGLSPKFYTRIIRFNYIYSLVQKEKMSWSRLAQMSGFYDQSHFISNFQEFTGEDPSEYFFEEENMANFFLNRN